MQSVAQILLAATSAVLATTASTQPVLGETIGTGLAGIPICGSPRVVLNHSLDPQSSHGVLHHFWCTGAPIQIDRMWVEYYVDGEVTPSIAFQPSMMCGLAFPTRIPKAKEYAAGGLCGKSAPVGGWWNTFPIPYYKSVIVTVRLDAMDGAGCSQGYVNIRGTVGLPLVLPGSGVPLPSGSRLRLQRNPLSVREPLEYLEVASLSAGTRGMVFQTSWAVEAKPEGGAYAGGGYIEGCWNFYRRSSEQYPGLVVGTGVEDYFDSGYYFGADSGLAVGETFATALSGLTLFERTEDGHERLSAYRFHNGDPLVMADGGRLTWRVGAKGKPGTTKCGNTLPPDHSDAEFQRTHSFKAPPRMLNPFRQLSAVNVTTYAWVYVFPAQMPASANIPIVAASDVLV